MSVDGIHYKFACIPRSRHDEHERSSESNSPRDHRPCPSPFRIARTERSRGKTDRRRWSRQWEGCLARDSGLCVRQRKVSTTPVHNEANDVSVTDIIPRVRDLNKKRGCPRSDQPKRDNGANDFAPNDAPRVKLRPCVKTMLPAGALEFGLPWFVSMF